jgi:hypothetical protein
MVTTCSGSSLYRSTTQAKSLAPEALTTTPIGASTQTILIQRPDERNRGEPAYISVVPARSGPLADHRSVLAGEPRHRRVIQRAGMRSIRRSSSLNTPPRHHAVSPSFTGAGFPQTEPVLRTKAPMSRPAPETMTRGDIRTSEWQRVGARQGCGLVGCVFAHRERSGDLASVLGEGSARAVPPPGGGRSFGVVFRLNCRLAQA